MDSKQFEELVAKLSGGATRRNAVKGVIGGALASVGVTSVAAKKGGQGKSKGKGKKHGHNKVPVCHNGKTKFVPQPALKAHLNHGDTPGPCPYVPEK